MEVFKQMKKIKSRLMLLVFGRNSLDGYYIPANVKSKKKNYIYASVFPDNDAINSLYKIEINAHKNSELKETHNT